LLDTELIRDKVLGETFISDIHYFKEIDSTNDYAKKLSDTDNVLVIADFQKSGKGRMGKQWFSEREKNLTFTIKKTFRLPPGKSSYVNFFFSYFLLEAIKDFLFKKFPNVNINELQIKWPNDILMGTRKLCGLLAESDANKNEYIIGIGINVNQEKFSPGLNACSLIEYTKSELRLSEMLIHIIQCYSRNLRLIEEEKYKKIFDLWRNSTKMIGKTIEFIDPKNTKKTAKIVDFLENGAIKLLIGGGEKVYLSGEIKIS
jgi:BirA family biotin operon repressor/biotin-[acetyl-CoA-carboxylase] ligase